MNMLCVDRLNNRCYIDDHKLNVTLVPDDMTQTKVRQENDYVLDRQKPQKLDADA